MSLVKGFSWLSGALETLGEGRFKGNTHCWDRNDLGRVAFIGSPNYFKGWHVFDELVPPGRG